MNAVSDMITMVEVDKAMRAKYHLDGEWRLKSFGMEMQSGIQDAVYKVEYDTWLGEKLTGIICVGELKSPRERTTDNA